MGGTNIAESRVSDAANAVPRRVLFLCMGLGELVRLVLLALIGASHLLASASGLAATGAWLLVYLAPHAAVASTFLFMAQRSEHLRTWSRLAIPAKLIGALAAAGAIGLDIASGSPAVVVVSFVGVPLPAWLLLAAVAAWDLAALAVLAAFSLADRPPAPPPAGPAAAPSNPVYRETEVEVVDDGDPAEQSPRG